MSHKECVLEKDENGANILTEAYIKQLVKKQGGFDTPSLNTSLIMQFVGKTLLIFLGISRM
jgi:hypothetical protein